MERDAEEQRKKQELKEIKQELHKTKYFQGLNKV